MEMNKVLGYVLSLVGLVGLAASSITKVKETLFSFLPENVIKIAGGSLLIGSVVILGVGVFILVITNKGGYSKTKQASEEVPIYEGTGKNKKIVGYRRG